MKCLSKTIRNEQHNTELNDVISKDEIEDITNDSKKSKQLKIRQNALIKKAKFLSGDYANCLMFQ